MGIRQEEGEEVHADELLRRYCTLVYSETRSYEETARRLALDRRTVKAKVDEDLLKRLAGDRPNGEQPLGERPASAG